MNIFLYLVSDLIECRIGCLQTKLFFSILGSNFASKHIALGCAVWNRFNFCLKFFLSHVFSINIFDTASYTDHVREANNMHLLV